MVRTIDGIKEPVLIVDILDIYSIAPIVMKFRSLRLVFYLHKGAGVFNSLAVKTLRRCGWSFEQISFTLSCEGAVSPFKEIQNVIMDAKRTSQERLFSHLLTTALGAISEYERRRLLTCFVNHAGRKIYHAMQLLVILYTKFPSKDNVRAVLLQKTVFSDIVGVAYRKMRFAPYFYSSFGSRTFVPRKGFYRDKIDPKDKTTYIYRIAKVALLIVYSLLCKLLVRLLLRAHLKRRAICVSVAGSNATETGNNMPWGMEENDDLKKSTLALHFPSLPEKSRDFYRRRAELFIEYSFNPFIGNKKKELVASWACFVNHLLKNVWMYRKLFGFRAINRWMARYLVDVLTYLSFYEALFRVNGTKVLWTADLDDSQTQMAAMAINRVGGASLGCTLSHSLFPEWDLELNKNDVYFAWGTKFVNIRIKSNDQTDSFVVTGYPMDRAFEPERKKASDFRPSLLKRYNANRILALYDIGSGPEHIVSREQFLAMYEELFAWLRKNEGTLLIIKAKRSDTIKRYPTLQEKVEHWRRKGRACVIYEKSVLYPGLASDLVISASPTPSSLFAALGHPLIFYNAQKVSGEYLFDSSNVQVIDELEELGGAIENAINGDLGLRHPEGMNRMRGSDVDPFVDGKARDRMREYIRELLRTLEMGYTNGEAIRFANERYRKIWGEDKVVRGPLPVDIRRL